jgi:hypothetical protein
VFLDVSQPYRPLRPVKGIAYTLLFSTLLLPAQDTVLRALGDVSEEVYPHFYMKYTSM